MTDYVDEELERLTQEPGPLPVLSSDRFWEPIHKLFSKKAVGVDIGQSIGDAIDLMRRYQYGAVVVTRAGKLAGIVTERDLLVKVIGVMDDFKSRNVSEAMTVAPFTLRADDPIVYAAHNMQVGGYRHIPIVDEHDAPVSIVSIKDVVRYVLSHFPKDIYNITQEPYRGPVSRESA